jgi:hypothetical protein
MQVKPMKCTPVVTHSNYTQQLRTVVLKYESLIRPSENYNDCRKISSAL